MAAYHAVAAHFPLALLTVAALFIALRAVSSGSLALAADRALVPLLLLGVLGAVAAFAVGTQVWSWDAVSASPLGRNHILTAAWSLAYWTLVLVIRWQGGDRVWQGVWRFVMLGLALLGSVLLAVTGTLGGHLRGSSTALSALLREAGWEVYTTFYLPDVTLAAVVLAAVSLGAIGVLMRRSRAA